MNRRDFVAAAAALALAPRSLAPRAPLALVTADLEARLVVVDLDGGRVVRRIPTLRSPRSIEAVGAAAVVAHSEVGAVSILDTRRLTVAHTLHGFGEPRYTAGHPDGRHAFLTDAKRGELVVLDVVRGRVVGRLEVGLLARHLSLDPAARTLWIALGSKAHELAVVDVTAPAAPRLVRRFRPPFLAHDVGFAPDGRHAWVTSADRSELALYDTATGRLVSRPSGDWPPQHVTFGRGRAYVTSGWSGTLRVHALDGHELVSNAVPVGSYNVQQSDGWVVTPSLGHGALTIVDAAGRVLRSERVARSSHDACVV